MLAGQRNCQERKAGEVIPPLDRVVVTDTDARGTEHFAISLSEFKHYNFWGQGEGQNKQVKSYLELLYIKGTPVYMQNFMDEILNK